MLFMIIWEPRAEKAKEVFQLLKAPSTGPSMPGYKTLYEFATPDGLLWYEIAEAESYERVTKVVSKYYPMVDKVTVQPLLRAEDFLAQF